MRTKPKNRTSRIECSPSESDPKARYGLTRSVWPSLRAQARVSLIGIAAACAAGLLFAAETRAGGCPCNGDVVPPFGPGQPNLGDVSAMIQCFQGGPCNCTPAWDVNCDGRFNSCDMDATFCQLGGPDPACCDDFGFCMISTPSPAKGDDTCQQNSPPQDTGIACSTDDHCAVGTFCNSKNRYVTVKPANIPCGFPTAIKITITSMPQFPDRVGGVWWAGSEQEIADAPGAPFRGAPLECTATPHSQIWTSGYLHLFGTAIISGATYDVRMCDENFHCSSPLPVATGVWGDVVPPLALGQPSFSDIAAVVDKFRGLPLASSVPRVDLVGLSAPGGPSLVDHRTDFSDISAVVDAFRGLVFPFIVPTCDP